MIGLPIHIYHAAQLRSSQLSLLKSVAAYSSSADEYIEAVELNDMAGRRPKPVSGKEWWYAGRR